MSRLADLPSYFWGSWIQTLATLDPPVPFAPAPPRPLILVPGAFCTGSVMNALGMKMAARGRSVGVPPSFPYTHSFLANLCRLEQAARQLFDWLDRTGRAAGFAEVDLLTHSNGGLITLLGVALVRAGAITCSVRVERVVTLACAYGGVPVARWLAPLLPCCRDVGPGAETLGLVAAGADRVVGCLVAGRDSLVPQENQALPGVPAKVLPTFQHMDFIVGSAAQLEQTADEVCTWLPIAC